MQRNVTGQLAEVHYVKGYASLAGFIASDPDKSTAIYRRFDRLAARNLLHLQSELVELEVRQDAMDAEDLDLGVSTTEKESSRDWRILKERARQVENIREKEKLEIAQDIRKTIRNYREALIQESVLLSLQNPSNRTLNAFRNAFNNVNEPGDTGYPTLGGRSARILEDPKDLIALHRTEPENRLTGFVRYYLPSLFVVQRTDGRLAYTSEHRIQVVVAIINVILAAVLLFGAILNLYYVVDETKRLGLIAGYTIFFAICVGLVTKAKSHEVFGACAAYAAVLVVFVSGNLGASGARLVCNNDRTVKQS